MSDKYILAGHKVVPCDDLMAWGRWFETAKRHVALTTPVTGIMVSTVFLGLDYRFGATGEPLVFETMIFGGEHDQYCERYSTWEEAEAGHKKAVELVATPPAAGIASEIQATKDNIKHIEEMDKCD